MTLATIASDPYKWMVAFHILLAVVWVGSGVFIQFLTYRASRAGADTELAYISGEIEFYGTRVLIPTSLAVVVLGFLLLHESEGAYDLGQTWVAFGFGVWIASFLTGALFLGPESGKLSTMLEEKGAAEPDYKRRLARIFLVSRIELLLLILVVLDMAVKPFL